MTHYNHITSATMMATATAVIILLGIISGSVLAGDFHTKSIEIVAWASPGGGSDRMCRAFAKSIEGVLHEKVYVVNKKGGGGSVGMAYVQNKAANGYTLLGVTNNLIFTPLTKPELKYSAKDFTPIIMWGFDVKSIAVATNGPYKTIEDLVNAAKQKPGGVKIGTFGLGTDDHITGYLLGREAGTKFGFVPFDSGGEQLAALLGGHIGATIAEIQEVGVQVDAGKVRILALATEQRLYGLPGVPTLREKGWNVVVPKFRGLVVKKGTPSEAVNYLISRSLMAIQTPTFKNYLNKSMIEPYFLVGEGFAELIQNQEKTFRKVLKELSF